MVNNYTSPLDFAFAALADPTRRQLLLRLAYGPMPIKDLRAPFGISAPAITKHLRILERAGLIERYRKGKRHFCQIRSTPVESALAWFDAFGEVARAAEKGQAPPQSARHDPDPAPTPRTPQPLDWACD